MPVAPGTRFDHYDIIAPLGKGGMGEVYLAEDTRLKRKVALKLLPSEFTLIYDRLRRFEQEAQATSALNHPNIITIFEVGAANGNHFITTEFIDGETLRQKLDHEKLSIKTALEIAMQAANALSAAHEAGIVHRDIKPENIMLRRDGFVKVLDFGLAKLGETRKAERGTLNEEAATLVQDIPPSAFSPHPSTEIGVVMGTASYMSPEQARGQKIDARTDLFSLGVVLYEMLAGQRPFDGVNMIDVMAGILDREPKPLIEAPPELQRIVSKSLQKDREQRYQTAKDLQLDLQALKEQLSFEAKLGAQAQGAQASRLRSERSDANATLASASADEQTISAPRQRAVLHALAALLGVRVFAGKRAIILASAAILLLTAAAYFFFNRKTAPAFAEREPLLLADFENRTGEDIWDGTLKQALAVALEQSPYMNIFPEERARDTMKLMNRSVDDPITRATGREICQRRNVRALLVGTIAKLERSYTVTLEATNAQSGERIALTLEQAAGRDEVVNALGRAATGLRGKLGESLATLQKFDKPLEEATTSSLDALKAYSEGSVLKKKGQFEPQIPFYQRAVELDDKFASAWRALGGVYIDIGNPGLGRQYLEKAYQLHERASEREKLVISNTFFREIVGDSDKTNEVAALIQKLYPQDAWGFYWFMVGCWQTGQYEKALEASREASRLDPDFTDAWSGVSSSLIRLNRFDEAADVTRQAWARKLDIWSLHTVLYSASFARNDVDEMSRQVAWFPGKLDAYRMLELQARAAAFGGRLRQAQQLWQQASTLAESRKLPSEIAGMQALEAEFNAQFGLSQPAIKQASQALSFVRNRKVELFWRRAARNYPLTGQTLALTFALSGDVARAQSLADELARNLPEHTINNGVWLPTIRAAIELKRNHPDKALQLLEAARQYDSAITIHFRSAWLRGQAYLQLKQGAQAAAEFQKIIDHRGWDVTSPLWPLAHLGLARAAMIEGDTAKARQSYEKFLQLWKDADADLPVLIEAKKEYEKLK